MVRSQSSVFTSPCNCHRNPRVGVPRRHRSSFSITAFLPSPPHLLGQPPVRRLSQELPSWSLASPVPDPPGSPSLSRCRPRVRPEQGASLAAGRVQPAQRGGTAFPALVLAVGPRGSSHTCLSELHAPCPRRRECFPRNVRIRLLRPQCPWAAGAAMAPPFIPVS